MRYQRGVSQQAASKSPRRQLEEAKRWDPLLPSGRLLSKTAPGFPVGPCPRRARIWEAVGCWDSGIPGHRSASCKSVKNVLGGQLERLFFPASGQHWLQMCGIPPDTHRAEGPCLPPAAGSSAVSFLLHKAAPPTSVFSTLVVHCCGRQGKLQCSLQQHHLKSGEMFCFAPSPSIQSHVTSALRHL